MSLLNIDWSEYIKYASRDKYEIHSDKLKDVDRITKFRIYYRELIYRGEIIELNIKKGHKEEIKEVF